MPPSVLLCDDHVLLLEALAGILLAHEFSDVQAVTAPTAALSLLEVRSFQVCLLDIAFPDEDGLTALREFRRIRPEMKVLILSATRDRRIVAEVLMEGALGFCRKDAEITEILAAIDRVAQGRRSMDSSLIRDMVRDYGISLGRTKALTDRERVILARLVGGESTEAVAQGLGIARSTARSHIQSIFMKLGVHSRLEAVAAITRAGIRLPVP